MNLDEMYRENAKVVYHFIYAKCQDPELAQDITQTTFMKAITQIDDFRGQCRLSSWLCQIARNVWLNDRRKNGRMTSLEAYMEERGEGVLREDDQILEGIIQRQESEKLKKAVYKLEEPFCEVMSMRLYGECSFEEIGQAFGRSATWARVTFYRAKEQVTRSVREGGNL